MAGIQQRPLYPSLEADLTLFPCQARRHPKPRRRLGVGKTNGSGVAIGNGVPQSPGKERDEPDFSSGWTCSSTGRRHMRTPEDGRRDIGRKSVVMSRMCTIK
ncbi:hypothetical protein E4U41_000861 [Claviceps citrina]|nr:hypothetical protein E4U41_000861 [Claviceps citrina]